MSESQIWKTLSYYQGECILLISINECIMCRFGKLVKVIEKYVISTLWTTFLMKHLYNCYRVSGLNLSFWILIILLYMSLVISVTESYPTLCDPMDRSMWGFSVCHHLLELAQTHVHWVMMPSNHLILCCPLLLLSIFPSIRLFSSGSVLSIRWPKYWSFSVSLSPFSEYSGLIFFRIDWFDLLVIQRALKSLH